MLELVHRSKHIFNQERREHFFHSSEFWATNDIVFRGRGLTEDFGNWP